MSESEKAKQEPVYRVKGIPANVYLIENGEFRWIPASSACGDKEKAKEILQVLGKMPEDRRVIWVSRLDQDQAKMTCPVFQKEADLCKEFDEFCTAYSKVRSEKADKGKGGESPNE